MSGRQESTPGPCGQASAVGIRSLFSLSVLWTPRLLFSRFPVCVSRATHSLPFPRLTTIYPALPRPVRPVCTRFRVTMRTPTLRHVSRSALLSRPSMPRRRTRLLLDSAPCLPRCQTRHLPLAPNSSTNLLLRSLQIAIPTLIHPPNGPTRRRQALLVKISGACSPMPSANPETPRASMRAGIASIRVRSRTVRESAGSCRSGRGIRERGRASATRNWRRHRVRLSLLSYAILTQSHLEHSRR